EKKGATLYTAWWYESGLHRTNNQFEWRWKSFKENRDYRLANITTASQAALDDAIKKWITESNAAVTLKP
ncbi:MAG: hypothetical protein EAY75_15510, partial [Bacteroidetes bacterium]